MSLSVFMASPPGAVKPITASLYLGLAGIGRCVSRSFLVKVAGSPYFFLIGNFISSSISIAFCPIRHVRS